MFPKLNWSAPQDAAWMNMGTLKCTAPGDIYLLLKSSDFISHDLYFPYDGCREADDKEAESSAAPSFSSSRTSETSSRQTAAFDDYSLVLRRWCDLRPERSFRCFVRQRQLVGISQRDCTAHFPQLSKAAADIERAIVSFLTSSGRVTKKMIEEEMAAAAAIATVSAQGAHEGRNSVVKARAVATAPELLQPWWERRVVDRYADDNFVADVYVDAKLKVFLVDCNVWGGSTDSLLFAWDQPPLAATCDDEISLSSLPAPPVNILASQDSPATLDASNIVSGSSKQPLMSGASGFQAQSQPVAASAAASIPPQTASSVARENEAEAWVTQQMMIGAQLTQLDLEEEEEEEGEANVTTATKNNAQPLLQLLRLVEKNAPVVSEAMDFGFEQGGHKFRSARFSEYRAPIEMHRFAAAMSGLGDTGTERDNGASGSSEDLVEFARFVRECEERGNTNR